MGSVDSGSSAGGCIVMICDSLLGVLLYKQWRIDALRSYYSAFRLTDTCIVL